MTGIRIEKELRNLKLEEQRKIDKENKEGLIKLVEIGINIIMEKIGKGKMMVQKMSKIEEPIEQEVKIGIIR